MVHTHFWRVGGSEERAAGTEGGAVGRILNWRSFGQEGLESRAWPNVEYAFTGPDLVAEGRMHNSGKHYFLYSAVIKLQRSTFYFIESCCLILILVSTLKNRIHPFIKLLLSMSSNPFNSLSVTWVLKYNEFSFQEDMVT